MSFLYHTDKGKKNKDFQNWQCKMNGPQCDTLHILLKNCWMANLKVCIKSLKMYLPYNSQFLEINPIEMLIQVYRVYM